MKTIGALWGNALAAGRTSPAYLVEEGDGWREVSWAEAGQAVEELANGLLALGVRKGDAFGILAQTSLEWALFDYALARIGAVGAAVYANSSAKDARYVLEHSDSIGVLVEDEAQREKVADLACLGGREIEACEAQMPLLGRDDAGLVRSVEGDCPGGVVPVALVFAPLEEHRAAARGDSRNAADPCQLEQSAPAQGAAHCATMAAMFERGSASASTERESPRRSAAATLV